MSERCPICHLPSVRLSLIGIEQEGQRTSWGEWRFCEGCQVYFADPLMSEEEACHYYEDGDYHREIEECEIGDRPKLSYLASQISGEAHRAQRVMEVMKQFGLRPNLFLDVGSSMGILAHSVSRAFECQVVGVEPFALYAHMKADFPVFRSLGEVNLRGFDVVTSIHTLEHVPNPVRFVQEIAGLMTPWGKLLLEVPTFSLEDKDSTANAFYQKAHQFVYTEKGLKKLLNGADLCVLAVLYSGWPYGVDREINMMVYAVKEG